MPTWISEHKGDITFVVSALCGVLLIVGGFFMGQEATMLLGAGVLGVPGYAKAAAA